MCFWWSIDEKWVKITFGILNEKSKSNESISNWYWVFLTPTLCAWISLKIIWAMINCFHRYGRTSFSVCQVHLFFIYWSFEMNFNRFIIGGLLFEMTVSNVYAFMRSCNMYVVWKILTLKMYRFRVLYNDKYIFFKFQIKRIWFSDKPVFAQVRRKFIKHAFIISRIINATFIYNVILGLSNLRKIRV